MELHQFEEKIDLFFENKELLKTAFTHRSFLNEHKAPGMEHNERLEFLGDAVLELVVTDFLFKKYPKKPEGELTALRSALVNSTMLSTVASELRFGDFLLLSKGEAKDTGRARSFILANAFESVIGALFLDGGYQKAEMFITRFLLPHISEVEEKRLWIDAKSFFQECAQEYANTTPTYKTHREIGPDHDKQFVVGLYIGSELVSEGQGRSKQEAETEAARVGLEKKGW